MSGRRRFSNAIIFLFIFLLVFCIESSVYAENMQIINKVKTMQAIRENTGENAEEQPEQASEGTETVRNLNSKASYMCFIGTSAVLLSKAEFRDFFEKAFQNSVVKDIKKSKKDGNSDVERENSQKDKDEEAVFPDPSKPMLALTFDDGPYSPVTDRILTQLETCHAHATFFVVGNRVGTYADSVRRAVQDGCQIGTHSYDHACALTALTTTQIQKQMHDTDIAVAYYTGVSPVLMRPVGGDVNDTVKAAVGKPLINWSIDTMDWKSKNAASVQQRVLNNVQDGDIILMHDLYGSTADACDVLIPELVNRGYQLVTVSELAAAKGQNMSNGKVYHYFR